MMHHIDAIYAQGVFRPVVPLPLAEDSRVRLTIESAPNAAPTESFYEAAARLGLIGTLQGGPADLSTHPRHMEGFGSARR